VRDTTRETADDVRDRTRDSRDARDRDRDVRDRRDTRDRDETNVRDDRDVRTTRDADRRDSRTDSRTDVRTTRDSRRVSRTQIDNFRAQSVTARDLGVTFGRATDRGLVIQDVSRTAVLANLGFRRNDVIVSVADHRIVNERDFTRWLFAEDLRNEMITIVVLRDGREVPIEVRPVTIIEELILVQDDYDPLHHFGVVLDDRSDREVVVVRVVPDSPAYAAGIRAGDVITTFRGQRITRPQQFVQVLERVDPGQVAIGVSRDQRVQEFQVDLPRMERRAATIDGDIDRPAIERREERRENRVERREERRDSVPGVQPVQPAPVRPARPGILPRNR
jgi:C-terminal processing protease CtpA/Prc